MELLELIDEKLQYDNGARYRGFLKERILALTDAFSESDNKGLRGHLGASLIGHECIRYLWYVYRHANNSGGNHPGKLIRLFNRGHLEEARFEALLLTAGLELWSHGEDGQQLRFHDFGHQFGGSLDGIVRGVPGFDKEPLLVEYKTHNDKNFKQLDTKGILSAYPKHYAQMQIYMHYYHLKNALYLGCNKNTDELYAEIVRYSPEAAEMYRDRASKVIRSRDVPPKLSESPGWFVCKWCDFKNQCHHGKEFNLKIKTCKNCHYISFTEQTVMCTYNVHRRNGYLVGEDRYNACVKWKAHRDLS